jgi:UV DNA damage endonuclease
MDRFVERCSTLPPDVRRRIVIENDDRNYTVQDCLFVSEKTKIPVLFDVFHHEMNSSGMCPADILFQVVQTWGKNDGIPMVDYSSQEPGARKGIHAEQLNTEHFRHFLDASRLFDIDVMLGIKEKERAAIRALEIASDDPRLSR